MLGPTGCPRPDSSQLPERQRNRDGEKSGEYSRCTTEADNLVGRYTMRMHMRRFTRLTNAFSKKFENPVHMVALYAVFYNFTKIHKALRVTRWRQG